MKTIHKYQLRIDDEQVIHTHEDLRILSVGIQHGGLVLWAMVDTEKPLLDRKVFVLGTGNPINNAPLGDFIGTVQIGAFVWHVFA